AASGKFAVNHDGWQAANAVLFCSRCNLVLMHVVDVDLVFRISKPLDRINRFLCRLRLSRRIDPGEPLSTSTQRLSRWELALDAAKRSKSTRQLTRPHRHRQPLLSRNKTCP